MTAKKKQSKKAEKKRKPVKETEETPDWDEETDFGGLPDRDLKKNLGCG